MLALQMRWLETLEGGQGSGESRQNIKRYEEVLIKKKHFYLVFFPITNSTIMKLMVLPVFKETVSLS